MPPAAPNTGGKTVVPVASPMKAYSALVVAKKAPYNTTGDLVDAVNKNPGKIRWGVGLYSSSHFALWISSNPPR